MFDIPVERLIPQREPFVLVDKITSHKDDLTKTSFFIPSTHLLLENNRLSAYGLIENMAQSAALRSGYQALSANEKPKVGFIGAIEKATIHHLPSSQQTITTEVRQTAQIMNFIIIECSSFLNNTLLSECSMKIVLQEEV